MYTHACLQHLATVDNTAYKTNRIWQTVHTEHCNYGTIGDTLYIAGTHTNSTIYDNLTNAPSILHNIPIFKKNIVQEHF